MTPSVTDLWRHPIKAHGREALERVTLSPDEAVPYDRTWAVAHDNAKLEGSGWALCANFTRGAKIPALMAMTASFDEATETVTLTHPDPGSCAFRPDTAPWEEFDWIGHTVRIGGAVLRIEEATGRCLATAANPETGRRDTDTLGVLEAGWGHTEFGVYGVVVEGGPVSRGDPVEVLA